MNVYRINAALLPFSSPAGPHTLDRCVFGLIKTEEINVDWRALLVMMRECILEYSLWGSLLFEGTTIFVSLDILQTIKG